MAASLVYMTAPSPGDAERIARLLVQKRLAACVNIVEGMRSFYWWEGEVQQGQEVVVVAKTRSDRVAQLTSAVVEAHPDECPCVVSMPLVDGHPDFLDWIEHEVR